MAFQFSFAPLLSAPGAIPFHALAAFAALAMGGVQFALKKGSFQHRLIGYAWVLSMAGVAISSFWIHQIRQLGDFSVIHLLSIFVLLQLPLGVHAARTGRIEAHRRIMRGVFVGGLIVAGGFTFLPGRIMRAVLFGS
jgi:uncharacterized membrane protein